MDTELRTNLERFGMEEQYRSFMEYARAHYAGERGHDYHLALKAGHSLNVFRHACRLAAAEKAFTASPTRARALVIAGLFHDFGRFMQFVRYKTFDDMASENHARIAVRELKRLGLFKREEPRARNLAMAAICLHNRFGLPQSMDRDAFAVTGAVRDADKLDIMRIMAAHLTAGGPVDKVVALGVKDSPEAAPAVLEAVTARRPGSYADMRTTTDFKLLVCGWLYDLNYAWTGKAAARAGHLRTLLSSLPGTPQLAAFVSRYTDDLAAHADAAD